MSPLRDFTTYTMYLLFIFISFVFPVRAAQISNHELGVSYNAEPKILDFRAQSTTPTLLGTGDYSCGPSKPCSNSACCGDSGWCGYGPKYCGDGCQSNCNATAECGEFASVAGKGCPLNVCCSQYGFCGTTAEFCNTGCQSNCEQPKPASKPSNVQQRVIGYWEAWNYQHDCGTMSVGEIPVNYLTHLNIAFGYIDSNFRVTNMDGLSTDIYKTVGDIKSRNPSLKIMIALGGWTFSDPGPWQSIFPTMVATEQNRATFIQNLLGFLSEYGYDGVDFDWEYPGADDRGGSAADGKKYGIFLRELREAITASKKEYLVTFTAPTSYWYLRHFDLPGMVPYVDWVNLMSYDLHGIWDSTNPIGNHVLAHTNLTEIDLALDLFWRVNIDPSDIVLGLGFYGRTFSLTSASCWKPGCLFDGPGAAGPCTATPGILSFGEIKTILKNTGATSFLDKDAAARYLLYGNNSWVSYDDEVTIQAKIQYANKIGLGGLMIWALDLDDSELSALRAVSDPSSLSTSGDSFTLVDLEHLFPKESLPPNGTHPKYSLVTFGGDGLNPSSSAFGFLLVAGDSHVVSSLRRRDDEPEPFFFLDCPEDILEQPNDQQQSARVVCLADDVKGCFRVLENGVKGTLVEMPDNCAPNQFARAISLTLSPNQDIPEHMHDIQPTSRVYDFVFDFNASLMRRDSNNTSIRMDYSNIKGYWDNVVDSPGIQSRDISKISDRYFGPSDFDWDKLFTDKQKLSYGEDHTHNVQSDLSSPLFWQTAEECKVDGANFDEGFAAYVEGDMDATFRYGFSFIATLKDGEFNAEQSHGLITTSGQLDLNFGISGLGDIDITKAGKGNPATVTERPKDSKLQGHGLAPKGVKAFVSFQPRWEVEHFMSTSNGKEYPDDEGPAQFNGRLSARIVSDLGGYTALYPVPEEQFPNTSVDRPKNKVEIGEDDVLFDTPGSGGRISLYTTVKFKLEVAYSFFHDVVHWYHGAPTMQYSSATGAVFEFFPGDPKERVTSCVNYTTISAITSEQFNASSLGWEDIGTQTFVEDVQSPPEGRVCYKTMQPDIKRSSVLNDAQHRKHINRHLKNAPELESTNPPGNSTNGTSSLQTLASRGFASMPNWGYTSDTGLLPDQILGNAANGLFDDSPTKFKCYNCLECSVDDPSERSDRCCGCISMSYRWGDSDRPPCDTCTSNMEEWRRSLVGSIGPREDTKEEEELVRRVNGKATISPKYVMVCGENYRSDSLGKYPAFPGDPTFQWDNIENGRWDPISRYWGNGSSICFNWDIKALVNADREWVPDPSNPGGSRLVRSNYQTEHVYEGQLIGEFFSSWLDQGHIRNQNPPAKNPQPKIPCGWTEKWMLDGSNVNTPWRLNGEDVIFMDLLLNELGSITNLDRLTIMLGRLNGAKGRLFSGISTAAETTYLSKTDDEQLQTVKDLGLIFSYLNASPVWDKYCATYQAIYDLLGTFDTWYAGHGQGIAVPSLQNEWDVYNHVVLESIVKRAKGEFDFMFQNRRTKLLPPYSLQWIVNSSANKGKLKFNLKCKNLDPTSYR